MFLPLDHETIHFPKVFGLQIFIVCEKANLQFEQTIFHLRKGSENFLDETEVDRFFITMFVTFLNLITD